VNKICIVASTLAVAALCTAGPALARDQLKVVGSSTVFPYSQAAAEEFAKKSSQKPPVVESTGTGGGMKIFCQGHEEVGVRALHQERRDRHHRDSDRL
jgi:phosphate transport system substrate-binding protein